MCKARIIATALVVLAVGLGMGGCRGKAKNPGADFILIADSLGEVPMHPDALKTDNLALAHDGNMATRWTSIGKMEPGFFIEIDLPRERKVTGLILDATPTPMGFPREFTVEVAGDDNEWVEVMRCTKKMTVMGLTTVKFPKPYKCSKILLTLTKGMPNWWSIYEMEVKYGD